MFKFNILRLLLIALFFVSKGQDTDVFKPDTVKSIVDTNVANPRKQFKIVSEWIGNIDTYRVNIFINDVFYKTCIVTDHENVILPSTIEYGDWIVLKSKKQKLGYHFRDQMVIKVKKVRFRYGTTDTVIVRVAKMRYMPFLPRKRLRGGTPRFRGMHQ